MKKKFRIRQKFFGSDKGFDFSENDAPAWLTSENTVKGSTMDGRWFWKEHVLTLEVGESIDTDFNTIKRIR